MPLDLKDTLNLPRTNFPMKAHLPQLEPKLLARWQEQKLYQRLREVRRDAARFILHDGPPYANGDVHLGTALNKILKDLIVKAKSMAGFNVPFVPGWDCHGLPIEINVDRELGKRKASLSALERRQKCREYAARYVELHRRDFKRLGCFGQWDEPYLTMSHDYEWLIADTFLTFLENGYVYKGLKPVLWCWYDQTALAEAEVEYELRTSPSIWVRYRVLPEGTPAKFPPDTFAIIWTTTPWTLPASLALAFNPQLRYAAVERDTGERYLLAEDLVARVEEETGYRFTKRLGVWRGEEFEPMQFQHPFLERKLRAVLADYVTLEQGSGIVHTAPGHGAEDYETGLRYGLEIYCPVDGEGRFSEEPFRGEQIFDANPQIVQLLRERGNLVGSGGTIEHSYPHCWRCHNPLIFRATEQWFISLDHPAGRGLRQRALEEIRKVRWFPPWGEERMAVMLETRPDWCISRQRVWGVPIPIFYCEACGEKFTDVPVLRQVVEWLKREGADAWYRHPAEELLPPGTRCRNCGQTRFRKETDILDVWFDSGSSHLAVLGHAKDLPWPADLYTEGNDQYRGWFHSSLLLALGVKNAAPYRQVVTHGWVLDAEGRPMSKSLGNVIAPAEVWSKYGAELLRIVAAALEYQDDMRISTALLEQFAEAYRKVRNTFRFCLANLYDFDPKRDSLPTEALHELDRCMLDSTAKLAESCRAAYENYAFHRVWHRVYHFCTVDLSAVYFDILKDRLYTTPARSAARRSAQMALYLIAHALARLLAPILSFTTEEVWQHLPDDGKKLESVHLALFPRDEELDARLSAQKRASWEKLFAVRGEVLKALERVRQLKAIRASLEAKVYLRVEGELARVLAPYYRELPQLFIVSQVELGRARQPAAQPTALPGLEIAVTPAEGKKCERCWNYSPHVGEYVNYPTVCERCIGALEEIEASRGSQ